MHITLQTGVVWNSTASVRVSSAPSQTLLYENLKHASRCDGQLLYLKSKI